MNYIRIDKFSKTPLYIQLKESIKNAIQTGVLKDKDKLPTEEFIGQVFNNFDNLAVIRFNLF